MKRIIQLRPLWVTLALVIILAGCQSPPAADVHSEHEHAATRTVYTCPMHPEIVEDAPGACPICGMDLAPKEIADEAATPAPEGKTLYTCSMHPNVISDKPGTCPICGMELVPVKAPAPSTGGEGKPAVTIDPTVQQNMGVRLAPVARGEVFRHVRTIGEVEVAENELSVINLRFSGWVERIWVDETGQYVKKGQKLLQIYSPEVVNAQEELVLAAKTWGEQHETTRAARRKLELWDVPAWHIDQVLKTGNAQMKLTIIAPRSGYVLLKNVVQGARVMAGEDLYRIGNLGVIWVKAEVYEFDAPWIAVGAPATMELSYQQGRTLSGTVNYIYPTLNDRSRTLSIRLEFANPGLTLRPGMFATVHIAAQKKSDVLTVPSEAVMASGERRFVFVNTAPGRFEPRDVVAGLVGDNRATEIVDGLREGETIVVSGQFLLDSESQLQEATQKLMAARAHNH